ncbi:MAG: CBS domain-containing protein, partial [Candidatus Baltobacteraceae bacterium]
MRVSDLQVSPLLSVEPETSLADVARRMRVEDSGSAAVMRGGRLLGIVTERDLVQAIADGIDPRESTASLFMSADPVT